MSGGAIISMIFIVGVVVGGFLYFLRLAMKNEKSKKV
ncbi:MetS family NSS transporter small subunit [Fulvivirga sp.]